MENLSTPSDEPTQPDNQPKETTGSLSDPYTLQRLQAAAKAHKPKGIKAKHVVKSTETIKVATAFGATSKEIEIQKVIEKTLVGEQEKVTTEVPAVDTLDAQVRAQLVANGTPEDQIETKVAEAKRLREALSGLWSESVNKTSSADDKYIDGLDVDGNGATVNPDSGNSGVRIRFTSSPRSDK